MLLECKICGTKFPALRERRYTVRDGMKIGLAATLSAISEEKIYDAFDCPTCGCQLIAQERKRACCEDIHDVCEEETYGAD